MECFNQFLKDRGHPTLTLLPEPTTQPTKSTECESQAKVSPNNLAVDPDVNVLSEFLNNDTLDMTDFLKKLASVHVRQACKHIDATKLSLPSLLKVGSLCAGSGTGELTFEAAVSYLSDHF